MTIRVDVPRANANEDQLQLIEIHVADGQTVVEGDLLFVLETTKAAVEVLAPSRGRVALKGHGVGAFVGVGDLLCEIGERVSHAPLEAGGLALADARTIAVSAKARKLARETGIDLDTIMPANGRIGEAEVRAALAARSQPPPKLKGAVGGWHPPRQASRRAVIVGGGGHAACLLDALEGNGYEIVGCTDRALPRGQEVYRGTRVIGTEDDLARLREEGVDFAFIGVGGADSSLSRRRLFETVAALGFVLPPVIHPRAVVAAGTVIGAGCHVLAGASIGPRCSLAENVIVNQGSILCHDSHVADHAHLTPGAVVAGGVTIGAMSVVGMAATVLFGVSVGENCLIHNGAQVNNDVEDDTILDARGVRHRR